MSNEKTNLTKKFEILNAEVLGDKYQFSGFYLTYNSELLGHTLSKDAEILQVQNGALSFRRDTENNPNIPVNIDHNGSSALNIVGNTVKAELNSVGLFGTAEIQDNTELAHKIKNGIIKNLSVDIIIKEFETIGKKDIITEAVVFGVALVGSGADPQATIKEFSVTDTTKIIEFSNILRNLGLNNKDSNTFISKFKEFIISGKDKEFLEIKNELENYKLLEKLQNARK